MRIGAIAAPGAETGIRKMARSGAIVATAAAVAAFSAGLILGRNIDRGDAEMRDSAGNPLVAPIARRSDGDGQARRPFQEVRAIDAPRAADAAAATDAFAFERLSILVDGDTPKACLRFTEELKADGPVSYQDFVRLSPAARPAISVDGRNLCLSGLSFDTEYRATVRKGFAAASGETLARNVEVTIAFGDKPAYVGFAGDGVILPRLDADGLALETVNVENVRLSIARVSDRSLVTKSLAAGGTVDEDDYYYVYGSEDGEDVGVPVFEEEIAVEGTRNERATTVFPMGAALNALTPGAYFVRLTDASSAAPEYRPAQAWRWILYTDIALTSYLSSEGLAVSVRSIQTGKSRAGVDLQLLAENNDILARATTGGDGFARFAKGAISGDGPLRPAVVMAYGQQSDFAALDLRRSPLDLSDRNVGGRSAPPVVDGYLYADRGIYRPGETVKLTALMRDAAGVAIDRKATLIVRRPNGVEAARMRVDRVDMGAFVREFELPRAAPRGVWSAVLEADGAGQSASIDFSVEDFVPQRLEVKLDADETTMLAPGEARPLRISSRYLYGAPAANLLVEAEARLRVDPNPFPSYRRFRFARVREDFQERLIPIAGQGAPSISTDAAGEATATLQLERPDNAASAPLRADVVVGVVEPGGRVVRESARIPFREFKRYVGLALKNEGTRVDKDATAEIDLVSLTNEGAPAASEIEWSIVEEDYWFEWYRQNGQWRWRRSFRDIPINDGRVTTGADGLGRVAERLKPGAYRISAADPATGASAELQFNVGWTSYASGVDRPDQAAMTLLTDDVAPGARVRLMLDAPYAGEATIVVATDRVLSTQQIKVEKGAREVVIDTDAAWGGGFYVLATVVTSRDAVDRPIPRRAMGVAYVPFDMSARTLTVALTAPDVVRPRSIVPLDVRIGGAARGEDVMLTVAAVDEGILRLTKFQSPDPVAHYYGKKRLALDIHDDYGRILDPNLGAPVRFGGDQIGGEGLTVVPTRSVALFNGPIRVDDEGRARVDLDLPDFNGELRLMAVAWSATKVGAGARPLTVRDRTPALLSLPRFLAPNDEAVATLLVDNVDGPVGEYDIRLNAGGAVVADARVETALARNEQAELVLDVRGGPVGVGEAMLSVNGPGDYFISRSYPIQTRSPYFPVTRSTTTRLAAGEAINLSSSLVDGFVEGSTEVIASFSPLRGIDPAPMLAALSRYPYGCSEQLTSVAMPLLYRNDLAAAAGRDADLATRGRVQEAINTLLNRQGADGAFGLWRVDDRNATPWLGAYVVDFLARAQMEGYGVPEAALDLAYSAMARIADLDSYAYVAYQPRPYEGAWSNDTPDQYRKRAAAYAMYVLARAGRANLSDLRYLHDAELMNIESPLARAHIGAALSMMGDRARALNAFDKARAALGYENTGDYYQTPLRDAAGVLALLTEVQGAAGVQSTTDYFLNAMRDPEMLHTQEKAFTLLAAQALLRSAGEVRVMNGETQVSPGAPAPRAAVSVADLAANPAFTNESEGPVFATVTVSGSPTQSPGAYAEGFELSKRILARDGSTVDLSAVRQNDRLVVVVSGRSLQERVNSSVIVDLLPAGFEIEAPLSIPDVRHGPYGWIGELSDFKIMEARDDRFVAAIDLRAESFTTAYLVRAVTPGAFALPGAVIEDMYRPGLGARTLDGRVSIAPAR
ncbi:MAG: alpha-2-macroglobulin family protein [Alphaproteobacteria bacterium]|nr:alpha-2-macroglobulin family protein [Alphaproteobacteria bacterium]